MEAWIKELTLEIYRGICGDEYDEERLEAIFLKENSNYPWPKGIWDDYDGKGYPQHGESHYDEESPNDDAIVLGYYEPMHSPGKIVFCKDGIKRLAICHARNLYSVHHIGRREALLLSVFFIVNDVHIHESFHYYCDVKRHLTDAQFDRKREEALAVAHSYMTIHREFIDDSFNFPTFSVGNKFYDCKDTLIKRHYSLYTLPGYRDWDRYNTLDHYETDFYAYLNDHQRKMDGLRRNGVRVGDVLVETKLLGDTGAEIYKESSGKRLLLKGITTIATTPRRMRKQFLFNGLILGVGRLVLAVVTDYAKKHPKSTDVKAAFKPKSVDIIVPSSSVVRKNNKKRFFDEPSELLHLTDGDFAVDHEWGTTGECGKSFDRFLDQARIAGYTITPIP